MSEYTIADIGPFPLVQVKAVGVAVAIGHASVLNEVPGASKAIEDAMSNMVAYCYSNGVTDPEQVKSAMLLARDKVVYELEQLVTSEGNQ